MPSHFESQANYLFDSFEKDSYNNLDQFHLEYKNLIGSYSNLEELNYLGEKLKKITSQLKSYQPIRIAVLSNSTTQLIETFLRSSLFTEKFNLEFYHCGFNQLYSDIVNRESGLYSFSPDIILILIDEQSVLDLVADSAIEQIKVGTEEFARYLQDNIKILCTYSSALIIVNSLIVPRTLLNSYIDYQSKQFLNLYFSNFNTKLFELGCQSRQIIVLETSTYLQEIDSLLRDERLSSVASMRWDQSILFQISKEIVKISLAKMGLSKKCLVVDLDNTLWGGIIGDDGIQGVRLGGSYEGDAYKKFQFLLKNLKNQGVLLAINSKNEFESVIEVFKRHPDMQLLIEDFVSIKINWVPKHENIKSIAQDLNISIDSLVFIDDNIAECTLVSGFLPSVTTLVLPKDPTLYISTLLENGYFNKLEVTHEDKARTEAYHAEVNRKILLSQFENYESYLKNLSISIRLFMPNSFELNRLSQLTLRTNQFNFNHQRFTVPQLEALSDTGFVVGIEAKDRFGSNGIIGALIGQIHENQFEIINFVLSCRVFSRNIEHAILRLVLDCAKQKGCTSVICKYVPTKKNHLVKSFLIDEKFIYLSSLGETEIFTYSLTQVLPPPSWIHYSNNIGTLS